MKMLFFALSYNLFHLYMKKMRLFYHLMKIKIARDYEFSMENWQEIMLFAAIKDWEKLFFYLFFVSRCTNHLQQHAFNKDAQSNMFFHKLICLLYHTNDNITWLDFQKLHRVNILNILKKIMIVDKNGKWSIFIGFSFFN